MHVIVNRHIGNKKITKFFLKSLNSSENFKKFFFLIKLKTKSNKPKINMKLTANLFAKLKKFNIPPKNKVIAIPVTIVKET